MLKTDCPVFVHLAATEIQGKAVLRVTKVVLQHNHQLSAEHYKLWMPVLMTVTITMLWMPVPHIRLLMVTLINCM